MTDPVIIFVLTALTGAVGKLWYELGEKDQTILELNHKIDSLVTTVYDLAMVGKTSKPSLKNKKIDEILERVKNL